MYPTTIVKTLIDEREHPEMVLIEQSHDRYYVRNYFWDGVTYQFQAVGNRYGYDKLVYAQRAHDKQVARCLASKASREARTQHAQDVVRGLKPRVRLAAIAKQITE